MLVFIYYNSEGSYVKGQWKVFIPAFSVTCIADIFRHPSFDMLSKQDGSKSTNHSPLAWIFEVVAHLHRGDMKQINTGMHQLWLAHFKQRVQRWCWKVNVEWCQKIVKLCNHGEWFLPCNISLQFAFLKLESKMTPNVKMWYNHIK